MSQIDLFLNYLNLINESTIQLTKQDYAKICSIRDKVTELAIKVSQPAPTYTKTTPVKEKTQTLAYQPITESAILLFEEFTNKSEGRDTLDELNEMTFGQLERIADYANMIKDRMAKGEQLESWMYSQLTTSLDNLNSVHDAMDGNDGRVE
jgi:hypothetical protein